MKRRKSKLARLLLTTLIDSTMSSLRKAIGLRNKVEAMKEYENFLKMVKEQNQDEFNELNDIVSRYNTLSESNKKLQKGLDDLNKLKEDVNVKTATYMKEKKTQRMTITNDIGEYQKKLEEIEDQKGKMQSNSEEMKSKKIEGTSEIGKIIMSIDNLLIKCESINNKKGTFNLVDSKIKTVENLAERGENAIVQLETIKDSIIDMQSLIKILEQNN
uniref:Uncharacterized protein n=1 Tax=Euplotes harpa TaxID=151035 RepID=A0A7S3JBC7_9SPIT|mmetsp:Transcript_30891/g.35287  ORF Transcript_30891/g.35287 Transcript_30891/m.35287 type:complete len:216 (+) Transcript_30891:284-931(+)